MISGVEYYESVKGLQRDVPPNSAWSRLYTELKQIIEFTYVKVTLAES